MTLKARIFPTLGALCLLSCGANTAGPAPTPAAEAEEEPYDEETCARALAQAGGAPFVHVVARPSPDGLSRFALLLGELNHCYDAGHLDLGLYEKVLVSFRAALTNWWRGPAFPELNALALSGASQGAGAIEAAVEWSARYVVAARHLRTIAATTPDPKTGEFPTREAIEKRLGHREFPNAFVRVDALTGLLTRQISGVSGEEQPESEADVLMTLWREALTYEALIWRAQGLNGGSGPSGLCCAPPADQKDAPPSLKFAGCGDSKVLPLEDCGITADRPPSLARYDNEGGEVPLFASGRAAQVVAHIAHVCGHTGPGLRDGRALGSTLLDYLGILGDFMEPDRLLVPWPGLAHHTDDTWGHGFTGSRYLTLNAAKAELRYDLGNACSLFAMRSAQDQWIGQLPLGHCALSCQGEACVDYEKAPGEWACTKTQCRAREATCRRGSDCGRGETCLPNALAPWTRSKPSFDRGMLGHAAYVLQDAVAATDSPLSALGALADLTLAISLPTKVAGNQAKPTRGVSAAQAAGGTYAELVVCLSNRVLFGDEATDCAALGAEAPTAACEAGTLRAEFAAGALPQRLAAAVGMLISSIDATSNAGSARGSGTVGAPSTGEGSSRILETATWCELKRLLSRDTLVAIGADVETYELVLSLATRDDSPLTGAQVAPIIKEGFARLHSELRDLCRHLAQEHCNAHHLAARHKSAVDSGDEAAIETLSTVLARMEILLANGSELLTLLNDARKHPGAIDDALGPDLPKLLAAGASYGHQARTLRKAKRVDEVQVPGE